MEDLSLSFSVKSEFKIKKYFQDLFVFIIKEDQVSGGKVRQRYWVNTHTRHQDYRRQLLPVMPQCSPLKCLKTLCHTEHIHWLGPQKAFNCKRPEQDWLKTFSEIGRVLSLKSLPVNFRRAFLGMDEECTDEEQRIAWHCPGRWWIKADLLLTLTKANWAGG